MNFYSVEGDLCEHILELDEYSYFNKKTTRALTERLIHYVTSFISCIDKQLTFEAVKENYIEYTPEYVAGKIMDVIYKKIVKKRSNQIEKKK